MGHFYIFIVSVSYKLIMLIFLAIMYSIWIPNYQTYCQVTTYNWQQTTNTDLERHPEN